MNVFNLCRVTAVYYNYIFFLCFRPDSEEEWAMDVLHDGFFHTEDNYICMTSGEELSKSRLDSKGKIASKGLFDKLDSSPHCKYQSGKYKGTKFIDKINYKLKPQSNKK